MAASWHISTGASTSRWREFSQTIATVPGREYVLSFDVGAFSPVNRDEQRMLVTIRGTKELLSDEVVVFAPGTGGRYQRHEVPFVADSKAATVVFEDSSRTTMVSIFCWITSV